MQQQVVPPDMGYLDNLNMNEQIMQSDLDAWSVCEGSYLHEHRANECLTI